MLKELLDSLIKKHYSDLIKIKSGYLVKIYTSENGCFTFRDTEIQNCILHQHVNCHLGCTKPLTLYEAMDCIYIDEIYEIDMFEIKVPEKYFTFIKAKVNNPLTLKQFANEYKESKKQKDGRESSTRHTGCY